MPHDTSRTKSGLSSGTRYWWAVRAVKGDDAPRWTDWGEVTTTGGASVRGVRFTSSPALGDTYLIGETIQAQVTWSQPVTVANGGSNRNVSLRLDLGTDDSDRSNSRRKMAWTGEGSGTDTLTFEYTVKRNDVDSDGVWLQTLSASHDRVVFLEGGATINGGIPVTSAAIRSRANMPTTGDVGRKVDDTRSGRLVGNSGQTADKTAATFRGEFGQQFTTDDRGYKLTSVSIRMSSTATNAPDYTVSIHENSGNGASSSPAGRLAMLQKPARALGVEGLYSFSAPGGGIDLKANTSYWVVVDVSAGTVESSIYVTASDDEDTGGVDGWSIADIIWRETMISHSGRRAASPSTWTSTAMPGPRR